MCRSCLGEEAKQIEDFVGDGSRWNLKIEYAFARTGKRRRNIYSRFNGSGLVGCSISADRFLYDVLEHFEPDGLHALKTTYYRAGQDPAFIYFRGKQDAGLLLSGELCECCGLDAVHAEAWAFNDIASYYELNMKMVAGEFTRYTTAGFSVGDCSSVGFNVHTPPSSQLRAPVLISDDCRFGPMTTIGPNAIVEKHVIVDSNSELIDCLVLSDTYIGRNLDIHGKIVAGNRVISPDDGTVIEMEDSWVVARNRPKMRTEDVVRYTLLWFIALAIVLLQVVPFLLLYPLVRICRIAKFERQVFHDPYTGYVKLPILVKQFERRSPIYSLFKAFSLDRFPLLILVVRGRLFLCGQPPMRHPEDDEMIRHLRRYYPGVFTYQDYNKESDRLVDSLWYAHIRSLYEDLKILAKALVSRFLRAGR